MGRQIMVYSPARHDPFEDLGMTPQGPSKRIYSEVIQDQRLQKEEVKIHEALSTKIKDGSLKIYWMTDLPACWVVSAHKKLIDSISAVLLKSY
ncbi:splicing factor 3B subunit 1 [Oopsacas minuta]|uniref:Splicing factor 3B subunit 1 n=1 Tax=Oopsacas minuta TaxID=111878 RepID=A0AAV7JTY4_9METZ|nr:splicing factor 3B subunit 1 [Oopsacas minuta]